MTRGDRGRVGPPRLYSQLPMSSQTLLPTPHVLPNLTPNSPCPPRLYSQLPMSSQTSLPFPMSSQTLLPTPHVLPDFTPNSPCRPKPHSPSLCPPRLQRAITYTFPEFASYLICLPRLIPLTPYAIPIFTPLYLRCDFTLPPCPMSSQT